jgi:alpha-tubulin suppressor-like RCC1 family protein
MARVNPNRSLQMRANIVRIASLAIAALSLAACREDSKDVLAPQSPDRLYVVDKPPIGILRPVFPNPEDFVEITAGYSHACARKYNGNVYCWGQNFAKPDLKPTLYFQGARQVDAGGSHTCALNAAGAAYCWGAGNQGQLGFGIGAITTWNLVAPVVGTGYDPAIPWQSLPPLTFTSISAGGNSTCGTTSGGVYCWGEQGTMTSTPYSPQPALISTYNGMTSLSVGAVHSCGYVDWAHEVYCWNGNEFGQAGSALTYFYPGTSKLIFAMSTGLGSAVSRVSAGGYHTCADQMNGTVQCFGMNTEGQLGNGQSGYGVTFIPQNVGNGQQLHGVSAGNRHSCALDVNNKAWCWGDGWYGQLGQGASIRTSTTPVQVDETHTGAHTFRAIAAGGRHTCAIGTDNHIYCWGQLDYGQLGIGAVYPPGYYPWPVQALDP